MNQSQAAATAPEEWWRTTDPAAGPFNSQFPPPQFLPRPDWKKENQAVQGKDRTTQQDPPSKTGPNPAKGTATAVDERDMHGDNEPMISGPPCPISNPSILGQAEQMSASASATASATASSATVIVTSSPLLSPSSSARSFPSETNVESHLGETKAQASVTLALNLAGDQSGTSSIINKHHNCCKTAGDDVVSQRLEQPLLQPPQHAASTESSHGM